VQDTSFSVRLRWRRALHIGAHPDAHVEHAPAAPADQSCPSIQRALTRVLKEQAKPEVLDLGPLCGETAIYLAGRGARVCVEEFASPTAAQTPIAIPQPDGKFHLVLAWEHADFTPPDRLRELGTELSRLLARGGWLLLLCRDNSTGAKLTQDRPSRWRIVADDRVVCEPGTGPERPRWAHLNRDLERALAPLAIQGIHLQRNRMREILALK
jgi:hypothetical protein